MEDLEKELKELQIQYDKVYYERNMLLKKYKLLNIEKRVKSYKQNYFKGEKNEIRRIRKIRSR